MSVYLVTCACGCGQCFYGYFGEFWSKACEQRAAGAS